MTDLLVEQHGNLTIGGMSDQILEYHKINADKTTAPDSQTD